MYVNVRARPRESSATASAGRGPSCDDAAQASNEEQHGGPAENPYQRRRSRPEEEAQDADEQQHISGDRKPQDKRAPASRGSLDREKVDDAKKQQWKHSRRQGTNPGSIERRILGDISGKLDGRRGEAPHDSHAEEDARAPGR